MLFIRADLSQAEDRVVKVLSHDAELIELARKKPWEFDVHRFNAGLLFEIPEPQVSRRERQAGKKIVHLSNYDGHAQRASDALLDEGFQISAAECQKRSDIYHRRFPGIRDGYQLRTRMLVIRDRKLTGSWGFSIAFPYERLDGALWRRAYAWRAQHEVGYLMNQKGVIVAYEWIEKYGLRSRIRFQVHDEIAIACPNVIEAWDLSRVIRESLEETREYEGEQLSIPADFALENRYHGRNENESIEWKRFPDQSTFQDAWERLSGFDVSGRARD